MQPHLALGEGWLGSRCVLLAFAAPRGRGRSRSWKDRVRGVCPSAPRVSGHHLCPRPGGRGGDVSLSLPPDPQAHSWGKSVRETTVDSMAAWQM